MAAGKVSWPTPRVATFLQWATAELRAGRHAERDSRGQGAPERALSSHEEWALFRAIAAELIPAHEFVTRRALVGQLRSAARLIDDWQIDATQLHRLGSPEARLLTTALTEFAARCRTLGARPVRQLVAALRPPAARPVVPASLELPRAHRRVLQQHGAEFIDDEHHDEISSQFLACTSVEDECIVVANWCAETLRDRPGSRLLVVVPDLDARHIALERTLSQTLEPSRWLASDDGSRAFAIEGGRRLNEFALVHHALTTLALLTRPLIFTALSGWLQSVFLATPGAEDRALLDRWLRTQGRLECSAATLALQLERAGTSLRNPAAILAERLRRAVAELPQGKRLARDWAQAFSAALDAVGWPGIRPLSSIEQQTRLRWNELLSEYAAIAVSLGPLSAQHAVDCLAELAAEVRFDAASPDVAVLVTDSLDPPVVHYDAIWVMGLDADTWPPPPAPHPLLPTRLQIEAGIETATAAGQLRRARRAMQAWGGACDSLHYSAPLTRDDAESQPSALISATTQPPARAVTLLQALRGDPSFELIDDTEGLAWPHDQAVPRGVAVFDLQTRCPFKAYAELRLNADQLELPEPGIDARKRGDWLHKALELFWQQTRTQSALILLADEALETRVRAVVDQALNKIGPLGDVELLARSVQRERARLERLLVECAALDRQRMPFSVVATEQVLATRIRDAQFRFKLDRVDQLHGEGARSTHETVLIDYKSGQPGRLGWLTDRLREPQLLVYALALRYQRKQPDDTSAPPLNLAALARLHLTRGRTSYLGLSADPGTLPAVRTPAIAAQNLRSRGTRGVVDVLGDTPREQWQLQVDRWQHAIEQLAQDYLQGTATVDPIDPDECKYCHLTTVCRRTELAETSESEDECDAEGGEAGL